MELDELRRAYDERAANAPTLRTDPDELIRLGKRSHRRRAALAAVAGAAVVAGIAGGLAVATRSTSGSPATIIPANPSSAEITATVTGTLREVGGPPGATEPGVPGALFFDPVGGGDRLSASAGSDGSFTIALPAGRYMVTGTSPDYGSGQMLCRAIGDVVVVPAAGLSGVEVTCERR